MKTKLRRFALYSLILTASLFIGLMLPDLHDGEARNFFLTNLIIAVSTGIMTPASLVFCKKSTSKPKE